VNLLKFLILFILSSLTIATKAQANLQIFPLKVDLSTRVKTSSVTVRNRGDQTTTYQISLVFYEQDLNGQMSPK
jgi:P pilus assembly chaperone PapD